MTTDRDTLERIQRMVDLNVPDPPHAFTVNEVLALGRKIWGQDKLTAEQIVVRLSVNVGKLARIARGATKDNLGKQNIVDRGKREVELAAGHIIVSMIRWADDLGLDVNHAIQEALYAQLRFAEENPER